MSAPTVAQKPTRKFPPPCWTRDEALVLIEAYRERWYALHRAFLRTPDWDAVAEKVTTTCPEVTPPKTSAQCRHKMEKLRQRHRAEKQRASSFVGDRFFSSWFYFEAMETMENGSNTEPNNKNPINSQITNPNPASGLNPGRGIRFKPTSVQNLVTLASSSTSNITKPSPNFNPRVSNHHSPYINNGSNQIEDDEDGSLVETPIEETSIPTAYRGKDPATLHKTPSIRPNPSIPLHQEPGRQGLRPRKFSKVVLENDGGADGGGMWIKVPRNTNMFRGKYDHQKNSNPGFEIGGKKRGNKMNNAGIVEVVSAIKVLGDGFMKMEKMKIDMAREMERMRMETEMKRNELILDSQRQIVEAFVKGLIESKQQTRTTMADL